MNNESISIDASASYDNYNLSNRNFTYKWTCPDNFSTICPTDPKESSVELSPSIRSNLSINTPGRLHRFSV